MKGGKGKSEQFGEGEFVFGQDHQTLLGLRRDFNYKTEPEKSGIFIFQLLLPNKNPPSSYAGGERNPPTFGE